jgi:hypothetical protein
MGALYYICAMYIDHLKEHQLIQTLIRRIPCVDPWTTVVLNVSPDYSSTFSMHMAHHLSAGGKMLDMYPVDVPFPQEDKHMYEVNFREAAARFPVLYDKIILCEAAVLSGNNYRWIKEVLLDLGYENDDIITTSLVQNVSSSFECDYVGEYSSSMPEFYYERYNKHWEL